MGGYEGGVEALRGYYGLVGCGDEGLGPRFREDDGGLGVTEEWGPFLGIAGWWVVETRAWVPAFAGMTEWAEVMEG